MASICTHKAFQEPEEARTYAQRATQAGGRVISIAHGPLLWHVFVTFHEQFQADEAGAWDPIGTDQDGK